MGKKYGRGRHPNSRRQLKPGNRGQGFKKGHQHYPPRPETVITQTLIAALADPCPGKQGSTRAGQLAHQALCYVEKRFSMGKVDRATVCLLIDILDRTEGKSPTRLNALQEAELIRQASTEELKEITDPRFSNCGAELQRGNR